MRTHKGTAIGSTLILLPKQEPIYQEPNMRGVIKNHIKLSWKWKNLSSITVLDIGVTY